MKAVPHHGRDGVKEFNKFSPPREVFPATGGALSSTGPVVEAGQQNRERRML
jgi:hypothetical protein